MRDQRFTFLCTREERDLVTQLSHQLERTEGDAVRVAIRKMAREVLPGSQPPTGSVLAPEMETANA